MAQPASPPLLRTRRGLMFTALPAIAVLAVLGTVLAIRHRDSVAGDRRQEAAQLGVAAAVNARRFLDDQLSILAAVAAAPVVRSMDLERMRPFLADVARNGRFTAGLGFVDRRGRAVVSSTRPPGSLPIFLGDRGYVRDALAGRPTVSDVLIGRLRSRPIIAFGYPTRARSGARSGMLAGSLALDRLDEALRRLLSAPGASETILDGADRVIVGPRAVRGIQPAPRGYPVGLLRRRGQGVLDGAKTDRGTRLLAFARVAGTSWLAVVDRDRDDVIGPLDDALRLEIGALVLLAGAGVLLTLATARRLDRLDRARHDDLEEQREIAVRLQRSLLPDLPSPTGIAVHADYVPAQGAMAVGGDWYDVVELGDGRLALSVGDVAGHGLAAAAVMGQLRSAVRAMALGRAAPVEALSQLDRFISTLVGRPLATVVYALLEPGGVLRYAAAGHPPPLVVRADGTTAFLDGGRSPLLGVELVEPRPEGCAELGPGDTLILYTDGLVERPGDTIDAGLATLARRAAEGPRDLARLTDALLATVSEPRRDDAAILCVRREGQPSSVDS